MRGLSIQRKQQRPNEFVAFRRRPFTGVTSMLQHAVADFVNCQSLFAATDSAVFHSLADAKLAENRVENLFHIHDANDFADCAQRLIKINRNVLAG